MRRRGLRNGLGGGLFLLGGVATLLAGTPPTADVIGRDQPGTIVITPPEVRSGDPGPAPTPAADAVRPANPLWAIPIKDLNVTRERPIFSPSRRPPPPAVAAAPYVPPPPPRPAGPQRPQLVLVGTVIGSKDGFGIFLDQATNTVLRLKTGDNHNGWVLLSVQGREATLQRDPDTAVLALPARDAEQSGILPAIADVPLAAEPPGNPRPGSHHDRDD
jgi:general secretion pathway protein N